MSKVYFFLFGFVFGLSEASGQTAINILASDSVVVIFMPLRSKGHFTANEEEFMLASNDFKKHFILRDEPRLLIIESCLETENMDTLKHRHSVKVLVVFQFYKGGKTVESVVMDCNGFMSFHSNPDIVLYNPKLNNYFKELTNQQGVVCGP